ncbi:hypothetical protein [Paraflavitalea speifideaquila]|uniref:hypothetical protein n=1 Tax=Paraflavitalea speifideaquila TaxID=3076558 RepID=UPI0028E95100|nr:hypothetical protein [Paraflavitalea speifideiaquila]
MRTMLTFLFALLITQLSVGQDKPAGLATGDQAPLFTGKDQHGKTVSLQEQLKKAL